MKHLFTIAILTLLAFSFAVAAQQQPTPSPEQPKPALAPLRIEGPALTELALAQTQVQSAQQALQSAQLNLELRQRQLLEQLGGSTADYVPTAQPDRGGNWYFPLKPKPAVAAKAEGGGK